MEGWDGVGTRWVVGANLQAEVDGQAWCVIPGAVEGHAVAHRFMSVASLERPAAVAGRYVGTGVDRSVVMGHPGCIMNVCWCPWWHAV